MAHVVCTTCGEEFKPRAGGPVRCPHCCTLLGDPVEPPAEALSDAWYYQVLGQQIGPMTFLDLQQQVRDGKVTPETLVRRAPKGRWLSAEQVTGLCNLADDRAEW